jgi:DNA (cytosine-5)-methyltransferase 1
MEHKSSNLLLAIDLFCGAGGFSAGFERAGIEVMAGVDYEESVLRTFEHTHDAKAVQHDISEGVPENLRSLSPDIVFGSPPCQGFSDARGSRYLDDDRNGLVFEFVHWVDVFQPQFAVMENVAGLVTISDGFMTVLEQEFADIGYGSFDYEILDSSEFGVPQNRKRVICVAVRDDVGVEASLPSGRFGDAEGLLPKVTVQEAFSDLPKPTQTGEVHLPSLDDITATPYIEYIRDGASATTNHVAQLPSNNEITQKIVSQLAPGEMYRSNRFGPRYRHVWDLLESDFSNVERDSLEFIAKHRSKKDYRIKGKSVGHVDTEKIVSELDEKKEVIRNALTELLDSGWLREDTVSGRHGYDLNSKSGIRPRYMRLQPDGQSNTILTTDFTPREKMHPFDDRGLSLREGARIQSFPDTFEFLGSFNEIATQVGNAVPPRLAGAIGQHILQLNSKVQ